MISRAQLDSLVSQINGLLKRRFRKDAGRCWVNSYDFGRVVMRIWKGAPREYLEFSGALEVKQALEMLWVKRIGPHG